MMTEDEVTKACQPFPEVPVRPDSVLYMSRMELTRYAHSLEAWQEHARLVIRLANQNTDEQRTRAEEAEHRLREQF